VTNRLSLFRHLDDKMLRRRHFDFAIPYPRFVQVQNSCLTKTRAAFSEFHKQPMQPSRPTLLKNYIADTIYSSVLIISVHDILHKIISVHLSVRHSRHQTAANRFLSCIALKEDSSTFKTVLHMLLFSNAVCAMGYYAACFQGWIHECSDCSVNKSFTNLGNPH